MVNGFVAIIICLMDGLHIIFGKNESKLNRNDLNDNVYCLIFNDAHYEHLLVSFVRYYSPIFISSSAALVHRKLTNADDATSINLASANVGSISFSISA